MDLHLIPQLCHGIRILFCIILKVQFSLVVHEVSSSWDSPPNFELASTPGDLDLNSPPQILDRGEFKFWRRVPD